MLRGIGGFTFDAGRWPEVHVACKPSDYSSENDKYKQRHAKVICLLQNGSIILASFFQHNKVLLFTFVYFGFRKIFQAIKVAADQTFHISPDFVISGE